MFARSELQSRFVGARNTKMFIDHVGDLIVLEEIDRLFGLSTLTRGPSP